MWPSGWFWLSTSFCVLHPGGGLRPTGKARGAQENLWPKFILESAPLRATSSVLSLCIPRAISKLHKIHGNRGWAMRSNCQSARKNYVTSPVARGFPKIRIWKTFYFHLRIAPFDPRTFFSSDSFRRRNCDDFPKQTTASQRLFALRILFQKNFESWQNGAPWEIRTPDLLVRSQTLYPTELRARLKLKEDFQIIQYEKTSGLAAVHLSLLPRRAFNSSRPFPLFRYFSRRTASTRVS